MKTVARFFRRLSACVALTTALIYAAAQPVQAALPTVEPPSSGGGGGLMEMLKGYLQDGIVLVGLVMAAVSFIVVA
ncbi:TIGR03745 family integrating conjugative element membrane protein, partial [Serratia sp. CY85251]|uniref:TIGR03745 family integrating conjugative element membrane protein n=1 Tax=Serratia sp. CY85251 TaxID=3383696 RepID=UPI003F9F4A02